MLRKIEFVMIRVSDLPGALNFYADVFGLKPLWEDQNRGQAGLLFQDSATQVVLHTDPNIPGQVEVHYLVDDVDAAVQKYLNQGCIILTEPFEVHNGKCAVIQDPFGIRLCILDMSRTRAETGQL